MKITEHPSIGEIGSALQDDGYAMLPNFFTAADIARMREILGTFFGSGRGVVYNLGKTQPNASIECPELSWLFADPRVVQLFGSLCGAEGTMFTGHCDLHDSIVSNWHRDTGGPGHPYFDEDCFSPGCRVYKMAIYLQDHGDGTGLTVRPGSHRTDGPGERAPVTLRSAAGDVVLFDVRIRHRGREPSRFERLLLRGGRLLRRAASRLGGGETAGQPVWTFRLREMLDRMTGTAPRLSIFFTFGADNRFTEQFARNNMQRQLDQTGNAGLAYPPKLLEELARCDVAVYRG